MTRPEAAYDRLARRETHSPRSVVAMLLEILLIVLCVWLASEIVLHMMSRPALLAEPAAMARAVVNVPTAPTAYVIAAGAVATAAGIILCVVGIAPGRRARHRFDTDRAIAVVNDDAIAAALARRAARSAGVDPANVGVTITRTRATVTIVPPSGSTLDVERVREAIDRELEHYSLDPPIQPTVVISPQGRVGS